MPTILKNYIKVVIIFGRNNLLGKCQYGVFKKLFIARFYRNNKRKMEMKFLNNIIVHFQLFRYQLQTYTLLAQNNHKKKCQH